MLKHKLENEKYIEIDSILREVAQKYDTPSYVYFTSHIEDKILELSKEFNNKFSLSYAVKSNPNPELLSWMKTKVRYLDVSSIGEFKLALKSGWNASELSFTGPGKREYEINEAIKTGIGELILESVVEARLADQIAQKYGVVQNVMVRIAPKEVPKGFGDYMAGRPSAFGIDVEDIYEELPKILALKNLKVIGLHVYSGTQCLKPEAIGENYRIFLDIFNSVCNKYQFNPEKLVFGSGLGIPYHEGDEPIDLKSTAKLFNKEVIDFKNTKNFKNTELVLELGRFLVGEAGYFLTKVIRIKRSRGVRLGICDGGLNNHLAASGNFGMVLHRNYIMHKVGGGEVSEKINLVGPLCTSIDKLANGISLPSINEGDFIAIHNSGSYGLTASPVHFISHRLPKEILVENGILRDISRSLSDL